MPNADDPKPNEHAVPTAEQRETEDLLSGFDRPARTPRTPPVERDFVAYHLRRGRSDPALRAAPPAAAAAAAEPPRSAKRSATTFVLPRSPSPFPRWLPWAALLVAMPIAGGGAAYIGLRRGGGGTGTAAPGGSTGASAGAGTSVPSASASTSAVPRAAGSGRD